MPWVPQLVLKQSSTCVQSQFFPEAWESSGSWILGGSPPRFPKHSPKRYTDYFPQCGPQYIIIFSNLKIIYNNILAQHVLGSEKHTSIDATYKKWDGKMARGMENNFLCSVGETVQKCFADSPVLVFTGENIIPVLVNMFTSP